MIALSVATWRQARRWGMMQLMLARIDEGQREADYLLKSDPGDLSPAVLKPDEKMPESEWVRYVQAIRRRCTREPLQYIKSETEFYSLALRVQPGVLIPRPETELIVEQFLKRSEVLPRGKIFEIGTGSGAISIALAVNLTSHKLCASDISPAALRIARDNAQRHAVADRIDFLCGDLFEPVKGEKFAAVVSNPPYVKSSEIRDLAPEIYDHEPTEALDGGRDGLDVMRRIIAKAPEYLVDGGAIFLEVGMGQADAVADLCCDYIGKDVHIFSDLSEVKRVVMCREHK